MRAIVRSLHLFYSESRGRNETQETNCCEPRRDIASATVSRVPSYLRRFSAAFTKLQFITKIAIPPPRIYNYFFFQFVSIYTRAIMQ